jgi:uncharacterized membrane protein
MFGFLFSAAATIATVIAGLGGYILSRTFVRRRLRFVDAIQSPAAPIIAGVIAFAVAWPLTLLPIVTISAAILFGLGCGFGTASGVKALRRGDWQTRQLRP